MSAAFAFAALAVTCARAAGASKVLAEPLRTYDPVSHRVGIILQIGEDAESFVVGAQGITSTYNAEFFCRKISSPAASNQRYQLCSVGLYYVWDDSRPTAGTGLYRDSWTYVQACSPEACSERVYEAHLQCDSEGGSGCPCWMFVRTDPSVSCDSGDPATDGADPRGPAPGNPLD